MAIDYKLMRATGGLPKNAELKVITVERQTASLRRMSKSIEQATSLTTGDILATIIALKSEMIAELKMGNRVHIPGIGYFSLALKGDIYRDSRSNRPRLRNAAIRKIKFRPDAEFLRDLGGIEIRNITDEYGTAAVPNSDEINAAVENLLTNGHVFTSEQFRRSLDLSKSTSYRLLTKLESEGKIVNIGSRRCKLFRKA